MLTERFDESLILLKDMWQLEFKDIVSLKAKDQSCKFAELSELSHGSAQLSSPFNEIG